MGSFDEFGSLECRQRVTIKSTVPTSKLQAWFYCNTTRSNGMLLVWQRMHGKYLVLGGLMRRGKLFWRVFDSSAFHSPRCHRDSIGSDGSTWEGKKVGIAVNSADSIEAVLYIALGRLNFIQGLSSRRIRGTVYAFKIPPPTHLTALKTKGIRPWYSELWNCLICLILRLARFHPLATRKGIRDIDKIW